MKCGQTGGTCSIQERRHFVADLSYGRWNEIVQEKVESKVFEELSLSQVEARLKNDRRQQAKVDDVVRDLICGVGDRNVAREDIQLREGEEASVEDAAKKHASTRTGQQLL